MPERIAILTGNHLCHNPRVIKEAGALAQADYDVEVLGAWFDPDLKTKDQQLLEQGVGFHFAPVVDLTVDSAKQLGARARSKLGKLMHRSFQLENEWQLNANLAALKKAANKSSADLFIAHSEVGMAAAVEMRRYGRKVGVDMEDWFSEDLLPEARKERPVQLLRSLEKELLSEGSHKTCPSNAMAEGLAQEYRCLPPVVVYNAFPWTDRKKLDGEVKDRRDRGIPSIHWYSQTLGDGRGIEELIAALPLLQHKAEVHLRGQPVGDFVNRLRAMVPDQWRDRIFIHGLVSNDELLSRIAEHDIGFAGEQTFSRSRDLTVTNKILHFMLVGLAVVASDTAGQKEIAAQAPGAVTLYPGGDPASLAESLNDLLGSTERLSRSKAAALRSSEETFCWEQQAPALLQSVRAALKIA